MTTLAEKYLKAMAFDYIGAINASLRWDAINRGGPELFKDGAQYEHARTQALMKAVANCIEALERVGVPANLSWIDAWEVLSIRMEIAHEALAELRAVVEGSGE